MIPFALCVFFLWNKTVIDRWATWFFGSVSRKTAVQLDWVPQFQVKIKNKPRCRAIQSISISNYGFLWDTQIIWTSSSAWRLSPFCRVSSVAVWPWNLADVADLVRCGTWRKRWRAPRSSESRPQPVLEEGKCQQHDRTKSNSSTKNQEFLEILIWFYSSLFYDLICLVQSLVHLIINKKGASEITQSTTVLEEGNHSVA